MAGLVEGDQAPSHQIISGCSLVNVERSAKLGTADHHIETNAENSALELNSIMTHPFCNDHTFFKIPALHVSRKRDEQVCIVPHPAQTFSATDQAPEMLGLKLQLVGFGLQIIKCDDLKSSGMHGFHARHEIFPRCRAQATGADLRVNQTTSEKNQE